MIDAPRDLGTDLAQVVAAERARLLRLAGRLMGNRADAEEVLQEGLLRAHGSLGMFRGECNLAGWVGRIVVNEALHRLRRRRLARRMAQLTGRETELNYFGWQSTEPDPEQRAAEKERKIRLYSVLEELPARQRVMVTLRYLEQMSIEEVANLTGVGAGTVKTHLVRALKKLRRSLARKGGTGGVP